MYWDIRSVRKYQLNSDECLNIAGFQGYLGRDRESKESISEDIKFQTTYMNYYFFCWVVVSVLLSLLLNINNEIIKLFVESNNITASYDLHYLELSFYL